MSDWRAEDGALSVILPTLNEEENIIPMLDAVLSLYPRARIIVVDDSSTDGTQEKVLAYSRSNPRVSLIERDPGDKGLTASIMDGLVMTETPYFAVLDADFQHPPEAIGDLIDEIEKGNDLVVGVRNDRRKLPFARKISSWGAHRMASAYLRFKGQPGSKDTMSGFFSGRTDVCRKTILEHFGKFERQGFKALFDLLKFAPRDLKVSEVGFEFGERRGGTSKLNSKTVLSIMNQCGIVGKGLAIATSFFLLSMLGRFVTAFILGLFTTLLFLTMTGQPWRNIEVFPMILSFLLAIGYVVISNEFLSGKRRGNGLIRGIKIVFTAFTGFLINLGLFYAIATELPEFQIMPMFLGFGIAASYDTLGCIMHSD